MDTNKKMKKKIVIGIALVAMSLMLAPSVSADSTFPWTFPITFGAGDEDCTTPTISNLTNSTPGTTNVTITWDTNQSADNIVKYSKNSDLSPPFVTSDWQNDTSSISIDISSLDLGIPYYYQAWSYNGINSSCYVIEPTSEPYKNFTTQSSEGEYNITLLTGYNQIGWTNTTQQDAVYLCNDIGANCTWIGKLNPSGVYTKKHCGYPGGDFDVKRGWGYEATISAETKWIRNETEGGIYNITLLTGYNQIGWSNTTATDSPGLCANIGANCTWVGKLSAGGSYTKKHCGYPGGDFDILQGCGYEVTITAETKWERNT